MVSLGTFGIYQISYFWLVQIVLNFFYILDEITASRVVCCEACLHWHRGGHDSTSKLLLRFIIFEKSQWRKVNKQAAADISFS